MIRGFQIQNIRHSVTSYRATALTVTAGMEKSAKVPRLKKESGRVAVVRPDRYEEQLEEKIAEMKDYFAEFALPDMKVFKSSPSHYRMRTEFRVWHEGDDLYYVMFEKMDEVTKKPCRVRKDTFPVASKLINELMPAVLEESKKTEVLRKRLYQVNFHTTLKGEAMVSMIYHKKLESDWEDAARKLGSVLAESASCTSNRVHIIGRSKGQKIAIDQDYVTEELEVNGRKYRYKQVEASFSQPNAVVCQHMLSWAVDVTSGILEKSTTDEQDKCMENNTSSEMSRRGLVELYCGNCNFTIPVARNFSSVVATEVSKVSIEAAKKNLEDNDVKNVTVARMSSEDFSARFRSGNLGKRLEGVDVVQLNASSTVLVDPPRCGLDSLTLSLVREFDKIVYISCNPETLRDNLKDLSNSHKILHFAVFDQFPYTSHLECGAYLQRYKRRCD